MITTHKKYFLTASFLCGFFAPTSGLLAKSLEDAVLHAVENHPLVTSLHAAQGAAKQTILEEKSAYYPSVNVGGAFGRVYSDNTTTRGLTVSRGAGYSWYGEGTASVNQSIFDWSTTENGVNAAKSRHQSAGANLLNQELSIAIQAAQSYLQLLRSEAILKRAQSNHNKMIGYYDRIKSSFDNGGAEESEVSRAQDFLSLAKNSVIQFESEVQIAKANYRESVGELPDGDSVEPSIDMAVLPDNLDDAVMLAVTKNVQIAAAQLDEKASQFDYEREKSSGLPTLGAEISASKKDQKDIIGGESEDLRGLVRANWTFNFGGGRNAAEERASLISRELKMNKEALQRTIERDVEVAWISLNLVQQQKTNQEDRLSAAKKTYKTFEEQYEGGQQKILDVMSVSFALFNARQDYLNAKYQEMNAFYQLMGVMGLPFYKDFADVEHSDAG